MGRGRSGGAPKVLCRNVGTQRVPLRERRGSAGGAREGADADFRFVDLLLPGLACELPLSSTQAHCYLSGTIHS